MFNPELRKRLSEISRGKGPEVVFVPDEPRAEDYDPKFDFSGREDQSSFGNLMVCEYDMADILPDAADIVSRVKSMGTVQGHDPSKLLFLDLETCGLSGCPLFLIGLMQLTGDKFEIRQLFARDYSEERALLDYLNRLTQDVDGLVTFNGKTFDVPFLRDRMIYHRLDFNAPRVHLDLLYSARRTWSNRLPNCKLQTLEEYICGRKRRGDVPGSRIPGIYHSYVRSGDLEPLVPVFRHNVMDLMTMAELLPYLQ